jgi:hypothetical protein
MDAEKRRDVVQHRDKTISDENGGPGRDRTDDLFHAMEARSQLRHRPTCGDTTGSLAGYSNILAEPSEIVNALSTDCGEPFALTLADRAVAGERADRVREDRHHQLFKNRAASIHCEMCLYRLPSRATRGTWVFACGGTRDGAGKNLGPSLSLGMTEIRQPTPSWA